MRRPLDGLVQSTLSSAVFMKRHSASKREGLACFSDNIIKSCGVEG